MGELSYHENIISQSYLLSCSTSLPRGKLSVSGFERSLGLIVPPLTNALPPGVSSSSWLPLPPDAFERVSSSVSLRTMSSSPLYQSADISQQTPKAG
jgi:hypothetical protein